MPQLTPGENEIFAFITKADRDGFIADLTAAEPLARYAFNLDPDTSQDARWLVAVPKGHCCFLPTQTGYRDPNAR